MNIFMNETRRGSEDGFRMIRYYEGVVYFNVPHGLASQFINSGHAKEASLQDIDDQLTRAREAV